MSEAKLKGMLESCAGWRVKSERRMLLKLRGGTAAFQVRGIRSMAGSEERRQSVQGVQQW